MNPPKDLYEGHLAAVPVLALACASGVVTQPGAGGANAGAGGDQTDVSSSSSSSKSTGISVSAASGKGVTSSSTGVPTTCVTKEDCAALDGPCNTGNCINAMCVPAPANEGASCDDGMYCTDDDVCQAGMCVGGTQKFCPSPDSCHVGSCEEATQSCGSAPGNDGASCDDGDPCTYSGTCSAGACSKGPPVDCSNFDSVCGDGVCDPVLGCQAKPKNDGSSCDDGLFCTINDKCTAGSCAGDPNTCAPPGDICMIGMCDEPSQSCVAVPGNDGMACSDGNPCHVSAKCAAGTCAGGVAGNAGMMCDDGNGCTSGTKCVNGSCSGAAMTINACIDGDKCCPPGCAADKDCLYYVPGVQQNVDPAALVGWTQCFQQTYDQDQPTVSSILQQCTKAKLLTACRPVNAATFTLLAMGPRADVLFDCGQTANCTKQSNGVGWYFNDSWSWGFAQGGLDVNRDSCDFNVGNQVSPELRMCWHTNGGSISSGYRCGDNSLFDATWQRVIYQAD